MNFKWIENKKLQEKYAYVKHESGLSIYVIPKDFSSAYTIMATKYGSLQTAVRKDTETEFLPLPDGIAHFLEHKMFEEEDGSDAFDKFAPFGANANAYTSFDTTAYLFSTTGDVYQPLRVLLSFVTHPAFTKENVAKEQGIIGQEIAMCEDRPTTRLYYETMRALYENHPITKNICGTVDSIAEITPEILYRAYECFYCLSNMALCVVGRVEPSEVIKICDELLPVKPQPKVETPPLIKGVLPVKKRVSLKMPVAEPIFMLALKDAAAPNSGELLAKRKEMMEILNDLVFSASSPLHSRLYDNGLISGELSASYEAGNGYSHDLIAGSGKDPDKVYAVITEYLRALRETLPAEEDFLRIRRAHYAEEICFYDHTEDLGNAFIDDLFNNTDIFDSPERIMSVTYEETMQLFRTLFTEENLCMAVITPKAEGRRETE